MKTKTYKHGKLTYKAYLKPVGRGYEVGFLHGNKPLFVGNFLKSKEANTWYSKMNAEIKKFTEKYWITPKSPKAFYTKFITNHLYKNYYNWLNVEFPKHSRTFTKEFNKDLKKYTSIKKNMNKEEKIPLKNAA